MKRFKRFFPLLFALVLVLASPTYAKANNIELIEIKAEIQDDASVIVREHRIFNADQGTEHYLPFANLGQTELMDFKVFENGTELEDVGNWDTSLSLEKKAGKYGVNTTPEGFELCFGIGSYGRKDFTIEYRLSNFVRKLQDNKQAIYWQFINPGMDQVDKISIEVTNKKGFVYKFPETKIWGFGYAGTTEITESALKLVSGETFYQDNYMVLLAIFPEETFQTKASYDYTEQSLKDKAMDGATSTEGNSGQATQGQGPSTDYGNDGGYHPSDSSDNIDYGPSFEMPKISLSRILSMVLAPNIIMISIVIILISKFKKKKQVTGFSATVDKDFYFRDIPYDGDFTEISALIEAETKDYISAFILKWIQEGLLEDTTEMRGFIFKKEKLALVINRNIPPKFTSEHERILWNMVLRAAGDDQILSEHEFSRYLTRNLTEFNHFTDDISRDSKSTLADRGFLMKYMKRFLFFDYPDHKITDKGQDLLNNITGFKNYLRDFSLLNERGVGDVKLWSKYMIWAAMLGISKEVYEQLKIVDPNITQSMNYDSNTIFMTNNFAHAIMSEQTSLNNPSSSSSFGGGGGSSFGGGGGGASGGSFGGGTR